VNESSPLVVKVKVTVPIIGTMYKAIPDAKDAPRL